jgi:hypothetical protein
MLSAIIAAAMLKKKARKPGWRRAAKERGEGVACKRVEGVDVESSNLGSVDIYSEAATRQPAKVTPFAGGNEATV